MGDRFDFQRDAAYSSSGIVLNLGCNEDPAQLKINFPDKVINCDLEAWDATMGRPNAVDEVFDITKPWPFADDFAEMALFGDVLEHLPEDQIVAALREAHRVCERLIITVPIDTRIDGSQQYEDGAYNKHLTITTERVMRDCMDKAGWFLILGVEIPWGFDNINGLCIEAQKKV
jgi:predicted SAM-dependent methyltransferase